MQQLELPGGAPSMGALASWGRKRHITEESRNWRMMNVVGTLRDSSGRSTTYRASRAVHGADGKDFSISSK
ncbi:MAG: hypothetical protein ACRKFN_10800 [Desulfitobacterium sp.]